MASNRSIKLERDEEPLLTSTNSGNKNNNSNRSFLSSSASTRSFGESVIDSDGEDELYNGKVFKKNDITLWASDAVVLIVEHLQYYAILLALSEHWGWPVKWIDATSFTFIFNVDIWEFRKVETGLFHHSTVTFIDTSQLGFNYASYISAWAVILFLVCGGFAGVYVNWMRKRPLYLLLYIARWKRVMFLVLQFVSVPFGVAAARVFHCRLDETRGVEVMVVQNEFECHTGTHVAFMVLVLIIFLFLFFVYPFILIKWVREQVFSGDRKRHEGFLQLKEAEYEQGLDISWDLGQYHLFSSFTRPWILYNPLKFIFKLLFVAGFALSVRSPFWASASITTLFCLAFMALICKRPFRVGCFNVMIITSHLVIACNALIGNFMVRPPWENADNFQLVSFLRAPTVTYILVIINCSWLFVLFCWIVYLVLLNRGLIRNERIWPRLSYTSTRNNIGDDTKKYLKAALKARQTLERAQSAIPLFAPIHELSHQIQVINAFCREAEYISDPTHDTLWDLLDELIEAHNSLSPVSVFGLSGKSSIKETSEEFIRLMPAFRKRLKQREYDFILVPAVKRRLLLKMYILSVFVSKKQKRSPAETVTSKLQDALAMFDTRSIVSDFTEAGSAGSSSQSRRQVTPPSSQDSTRAPSNLTSLQSDMNMTSFINDVDKLVGNGKSTNSLSSTSTLSRSVKSASSQRTLSKSPSQKSFAGSISSSNNKSSKLSLQENKIHMSRSSSSSSKAPIGQSRQSLSSAKQSTSGPSRPNTGSRSSLTSVRSTQKTTGSLNASMVSLPNQIEDDDAMLIPREVRQSKTII